jgi:hypothetical protein
MPLISSFIVSLQGNSVSEHKRFISTIGILYCRPRTSAIISFTKHNLYTSFHKHNFVSTYYWGSRRHQILILRKVI